MSWPSARAALGGRSSGRRPIRPRRRHRAKDGRIRVIDHFMTASSHAAFFASGLARTLAASAPDFIDAIRSPGVDGDL
jgi:hypothetical protein